VPTSLPLKISKTRTVQRLPLPLLPQLRADPLQNSSERNFNMVESTNMSAATEQMKTVKAAWDKAPSGPKKDASLKHYQAAEKARSANNDAECIKELNAATSAQN
jgi:hypothetical protein